MLYVKERTNANIKRYDGIEHFSRVYIKVWCITCLLQLEGTDMHQIIAICILREQILRYFFVLDW